MQTWDTAALIKRRQRRDDAFMNAAAEDAAVPPPTARPRRVQFNRIEEEEDGTGVSTDLRNFRDGHHIGQRSPTREGSSVIRIEPKRVHKSRFGCWFTLCMGPKPDVKSTSSSGRTSSSSTTKSSMHSLEEKRAELQHNDEEDQAYVEEQELSMQTQHQEQLLHIENLVLT